MGRRANIGICNECGKVRVIRDGLCDDGEVNGCYERDYYRRIVQGCRRSAERLRPIAADAAARRRSRTVSELRRACRALWQRVVQCLLQRYR